MVIREKCKKEIDLSFANLSNADLLNDDLSDVNLTEVNLSYADLFFCKINKKVFKQVIKEWFRWKVD